MAEPSAVQRRGLAKMGLAMPDGSYYIRNGNVAASDLDNAIKAVGRGQEDSHNAIRVHIMKRAKACGLSDKIPADWQADGSLKHGEGMAHPSDDLDRQTDAFLEHFGIEGMRWGHHLPGVEVLGGSGNGGGDRKPAPFIQKGDHTGDKPGDSGPSGQDDSPHEQQANAALDALKALHDHVSQATEAARAEAEDADHAPEQAPEQAPSHPQPVAAPAKPAAKAPAKPAAKAPAKAKPKSKLTKKQATDIHTATKKHQAAVAQIHNKAKAAAAKHKANKAKLAKHANKAQANKASIAASKLHAAHMSHLKTVATKAHAAHLAHVAKLKATSTHKAGASTLNASDKAALSKLSPVQRSALKKLSPQQRSSLGKMTAAQRAKLAHLTPAEKTALSHLSPKQKEALAKATAASAKKRHEAAVARKAGTVKPAVKKPATIGSAAAKKITAAAQARRTPAQKAAIATLKKNAVNGNILRLSMDDPVGTFLEHHGIKGMKWGIRRNGGHPGEVHPVSADAQKAHGVSETIQKHGTAAVSNEDLQHLVNRLRLLSQHNQLVPADPSKVRKGLDFVKKASNDTKTVLDAVETGRRAVKTINGLASERPAPHQSRRTRNAPLKVVSVR